MADLFGKDLFGEPIRQERDSTLAKKFLLPPFSVLNCAEGWWQDRKRAWIGLGIRSELGREAMYRGEGSVYTGQSEWAGARNGSRAEGAEFQTGPRIPLGPYDEAPTTAEGRRRREGPVNPWPQRRPGGIGGSASAGGEEAVAVENGEAESAAPKRHAANTRGLTYGISANAYAAPKDENGAHPNEDPSQSGTSIFDPVLTECLVRWFSPPDGTIIDPFAGGSVRGIVSGCLGRRYYGVDLSERQVEANRQQAMAIECAAKPYWEVGDSRVEIEKAPEADMVLTCPPYADLEVYSDDPRDLSTMDYPAFLEAYSDIITKTIARLKNDRFACFVVGELRGPGPGYYRGFVPHTIEALGYAGAAYLNEIILVTARGSLPVRVERQFRASRKIGKTHQSIIIAVKGDPKKAAAACGDMADVAF